MDVGTCSPPSKCLAVFLHVFRIESLVVQRLIPIHGLCLCWNQELLFRRAKKLVCGAMIDAWVLHTRIRSFSVCLALVCGSWVDDEKQNK